MYGTFVVVPHPLRDVLGEFLIIALTLCSYMPLPQSRMDPWPYITTSSLVRLQSMLFIPYGGRIQPTVSSYNAEERSRAFNESDKTYRTLL